MNSNLNPIPNTKKGSLGMNSNLNPIHNTKKGTLSLGTLSPKYFLL